MPETSQPLASIRRRIHTQNDAAKEEVATNRCLPASGLVPSGEGVMFVNNGPVTTDLAKPHRET
jgi:hypothetical protein